MSLLFIKLFYMYLKQLIFTLKDKLLILLSQKYLRFILYIKNKSLVKQNEYRVNQLKLPKINTNKHSLVVLYRLSTYLSPKFTKVNDKYDLSKSCLNSFYSGFYDIKPYVVFIADSCDKKYINLLKECPFKYVIIRQKKLGNIGSFFLQLRISLLFDDQQKIYFLEDDYLHKSNVGKLMLQKLDEFQFITLYKHPDIRLVSFSSSSWAKINATTLTFATKVFWIKKNIDIFKKYGIFDYAMWLNITEKYSLGVPKLSLSTHLDDRKMVKGFIF